MLHVKLTVYYTVSFTCNIHFLNSTYFIFNQFKSNKFFVFLLLLSIYSLFVFKGMRLPSKQEVTKLAPVCKLGG